MAKETIGDLYQAKGELTTDMEVLQARLQVVQQRIVTYLNEQNGLRQGTGVDPGDSTSGGTKRKSE